MVCPTATCLVTAHSMKGQTMNDAISLTADIITMLGALLSAALEVHRTRRDARGDTEPPQT